MHLRVAVASLLVAALGSAAPAHETWMMPSAFTASVGQEVRLDVGSGMEFPLPESPIQAGRVTSAKYRLGGGEFDAAASTTNEGSLVLRQTFERAGLATVWLDLKPKEIVLTDDEVAEYLDEIDATLSVRSAWASQKGHRAWKETYTKHAKTFVAVGDASRDASWKLGVGAALEIVPTGNPSAVAVGGDFPVELWAGSKPLPNVSVGLMAEGSTHRVFRTTDAGGRATFPIERPGRALLFAVWLRPAADGQSWISDFCTVTFEAHRLQPTPAAPGQYVLIRETTALVDRTVVFTNLENGKPLEFPLGGNQVIAGVDEGVTGMRAGERRKLIVPPTLGTRTRYQDGLSPEATLYYDVELVEIVKD
jgi:uncharacterized GH25 family protein